MTPSEIIAPQGIEPALRAEMAGLDSGVLTTVIVCFVLNALVFPVLLRLWREFFKELTRTRRVDMAGEHTVSERWVMALSLLQTLLMESLVLFCAFRPAASAAMGSLGGMLLVASLMMVVQAVGYLLVGYAFAPEGETRSWLRAFFTSQSVLGYLLIIPAMGALFYPEASVAFITVCGVLYVLCRILFYIKSFTIFYTSPGSLFYFFLYLCTLEIVPLLAAWLIAGRFAPLFC